MHTAPFRADMVGSMLRSSALKQARLQRAAGTLSTSDLTGIEDREIQLLVRKLEAIGLTAITDGEFRRAWWHFDFLEHLVGCEGFEPSQGLQFHGMQTKPKSVRVVGKLDFPPDHPHLEHFAKLMAMVSPGHLAKMTIPSPSMLHFRGGRQTVPEAIYPDMAAYFHDLGMAYNKAIHAFYSAGCRYLQIDDVALAYFCDPAQRQMLIDRGDDPAALILQYRDTLALALQNRPRDMIITTHLCRGNFRSTFVATGGYDHVADMIFNAIDVDGYFMEWDDHRSGGFEPLRYLPKGKRVVLGLVTSKVGTMEATDAIKRRIDQAASYTAIDQLCLSAQCGFASTEEGNNIAEAEQWRKLEMIVSIARDVWR
jgi:5-methyltetrahydropteroyltriglutamate--homocysteine methyltransferase